MGQRRDCKSCGLLLFSVVKGRKIINWEQDFLYTGE
jgi:hypothetical protein